MYESSINIVLLQGTQIYDANKGAFKDLGILDVMQIFGRAGRPQYDDYGEGFIITTHDKLSHYLGLMTRQNPIESQFIESLADNLNAEVRVHVIPFLLKSKRTQKRYCVFFRDFVVIQKCLWRLPQMKNSNDVLGSNQIT